MTEPTLPPEPAKDASIDEIEQDIAVTRERLGETIDALEDKLDVSAQAKRKVDQTKAQLADRITQTRAQVTDRVVQTKAQMTDKLGQARTQATTKVTQLSTRTGEDPKSALPAAVGVTVGVAFLVWRQVRARKRS